MDLTAAQVVTMAGAGGGLAIGGGREASILDHTQVSSPKN